jgi:hypothetical protein
LLSAHLDGPDKSNSPLAGALEECLRLRLLATALTRRNKKQKTGKFHGFVEGAAHAAHAAHEYGSILLDDCSNGVPSTSRRTVGHLSAVMAGSEQTADRR